MGSQEIDGQTLKEFTLMMEKAAKEEAKLP